MAFVTPGYPESCPDDLNITFTLTVPPGFRPFIYLNLIDVLNTEIPEGLYGTFTWTCPKDQDYLDVVCEELVIMVIGSV